MVFLRVLISFVILCLAGQVGAQDGLSIPKLTTPVIDQTATLTPEQQRLLVSKLLTFESQKGAQIALLIVPTVRPETIEQFSLRVVESWKLGRKGVDDGVLLLVAKEDRALRIEVGYGLEGALNDATAKRIISEIISPYFRQGDFYGGVDAGLDAMIRVIDGEILPAPKNRQHAAAENSDLESLLPVAFILIFVVGGILRAIFGRFLAAGILGGVVGLIASILLSSVLIAILAGLVVFVFSLFSGVGGGGFSGGSSSSGGSSGGGFSGGGGSFGGGGASGGW